MKNIGALMKQAQQMQTKMAELQARMEELEETGTSGGGMVEVVLNGKGFMRHVKIDPSLAVVNDVEVLEDLIIAAFNDAKNKIDTRSQEEMSKLTGGLNLPAGMKLPF